MSTSGGSSGGSSGVSSFNTRTGAVVPATGDYAVAQVTGAAPLASPALTGTPTAPTKTALTNNTDVATTAYADGAVSVALGDVPSKPQDFGYLGWTGDPFLSGSNAQSASTKLFLVRFRCTVAGTAGHLVYTIATAGSSLTSNECFVGIYDSGQTTANTATLLSTSADQSGTWTTAGTYATAMSTPPTLVAGQDYFAAFLCNGSTQPFVVREGNTPALVNYGLSGVALRTAEPSAAQTSLPSTVTAANMPANTGSTFVFLVTT